MSEILVSGKNNKVVGCVISEKRLCETCKQETHGWDMKKIPCPYRNAQMVWSERV